jgi:hypothetical protein
VVSLIKETLARLAEMVSPTNLLLYLLQDGAGPPIGCVVNACLLLLLSLLLLLLLLCVEGVASLTSASSKLIAVEI